MVSALHDGVSKIERRHDRPIFGLLICVTLLWGLNFSVIKVLADSLAITWVCVLRMLIATLVLAAVFRLRGVHLPKLPLAVVPAILLCGFLAVYLNQIAFVSGVDLTTAGNATLTAALAPAIGAVAGAIAFRDRVTLPAWCGLLIGFLGVAFVIFGRGAQFGAAGAGELLILLAITGFICSGLIMQRLTRHLDALVLTLYIQIVGTAMLVVHVAWFEGWETMPFDAMGWSTVMLLLYSGAFGTALSNLGWYHAISKIGQRRASVFFYCIPLFGLMFSVLWLGETVDWQHGIGLLLVVGGTRLGIAHAHRT